MYFLSIFHSPPYVVLIFNGYWISMTPCGVKMLLISERSKQWYHVCAIFCRQMGQAQLWVLVVGCCANHSFPQMGRTILLLFGSFSASGGNSWGQWDFELFNQYLLHWVLNWIPVAEGDSGGKPNLVPCHYFCFYPSYNGIWIHRIWLICEGSKIHFEYLSIQKWLQRLSPWWKAPYI